MTPQTLFFGDKDRPFALTPDLVGELERLTGQGIGLFSRRMMQGDFHLGHLHHVIRLALIGAGEAPQTADALVRTFAAPRPVMEAYGLAVAILDALMNGPAQAGEASA